VCVDYSKGLDLSFISIPSSCYLVDVHSPDSDKYEVFYKGERLTNVQGIIINSLLPKTEKVKIENWKKEIED